MVGALAAALVAAVVIVAIGVVAIVGAGDIVDEDGTGFVAIGVDIGERAMLGFVTVGAVVSAGCVTEPGDVDMPPGAEGVPPDGAGLSPADGEARHDVGSNVSAGACCCAGPMGSAGVGAGAVGWTWTRVGAV